MGASNARDYAALLRIRSAEPVRLFIAHMDHPGFHGDRWLPRGRLQVSWHGGAPTRALRGAQVWLADRSRRVGAGVITHAVASPGGGTLSRLTLRVDDPQLAVHYPDPRILCGGFAFQAPVWQQGEKIYASAIDDLVGVYALLATARALWHKPGSRPPFLGLLTRAEEVGFIGATAHFELGWQRAARRPIIAVSLEASRTLPGAVIGRGPVVRLGDRRTVFDAGALAVLQTVAERVLPGAYQRRIMDGGACEATAATAYGLPAIGISVPLGNYHNQPLESGRGAAPEFAHMNDIAGELRLCEGLMAPGLPWSDPWAITRVNLRQRLAAAQPLLPL